MHEQAEFLRRCFCYDVPDDLECVGYISDDGGEGVVRLAGVLVSGEILKQAAEPYHLDELLFVKVRDQCRISDISAKGPVIVNTVTVETSELPSS